MTTKLGTYFMAISNNPQNTRKENYVPFKYILLHCRFEEKWEQYSFAEKEKNTRSL